MRIVDVDNIAALENVGLTVHDGEVPVDDSGQVVQSPMPYVVYYSALGDEDRERLDGQHSRADVPFQVTYVGTTREQAKWAGQKVRDTLRGRRPNVPGRRAWPVRLDDSQMIRPDEDVKTPDGRTIFYGVDRYTAAVSLHAAS